MLSTSDDDGGEGGGGGVICCLCRVVNKYPDKCGVSVKLHCIVQINTCSLRVVQRSISLSQVAVHRGRPTRSCSFITDSLLSSP